MTRSLVGEFRFREVSCKNLSKLSYPARRIRFTVLVAGVETGIGCCAVSPGISFGEALWAVGGLIIASSTSKGTPSN